MKIVNLFVAAISCLMTSASSPYLIKQCLDLRPGDTDGFGLRLAANDKYLVVGDLGRRANRIIVYRRDQNGKWLRTREILPPKDSTAYKVGRGFGYKLVIDGDILIIHTIANISRRYNHNKVGNLQDFHEERNIHILSSINTTYTTLYQTRLDRKTEVTRINLSDIPNQGAIPPSSVVAHRGKIGFILSQKRHEKRINQVYVLSNGKAHAMPNGKLEYIFPSKVRTMSVYGGSMALKNNLLLVSIPRTEDRGGVWLFDLNSPQSKPEQLTFPNAATPLSNSIAISERFVAVGNFPISIKRDLSDRFEKTLIRNIATGSTKIIDRAGGLFLDGNILARISSISEDFESPIVLELFRLDDDATPHLIQKRSDVERAVLQNGLLVTVRETTYGKRICTEQVR